MNLGTSLSEESKPAAPGSQPRVRRSLAVALDHRDHGVVVVRVRGELDSATVPRLSAALHRQLGSATCRLLVVDLRAVDFLGAQGIVVLDTARQHAQAYRIGFCLIANRAIRRILDALVLIQTFTFCDDINDQ